MNGQNGLLGRLFKPMIDRQVRQALALAERQGIPVERRHFIEGVPLFNICDFAHTHQSDIIVMGTVQHWGLDKLLGTTAESLLQRAPCSVWAIKPARG